MNKLLSQVLFFSFLFLLAFSFSSCCKDITEIARNSKITINTPQAGIVLTENPYREMSGNFTGDIPADVRVWILASEGNLYYMLYPDSEIVRADNSWTQKNIQIETTGNWELSVWLANSCASQWLDNKARSGAFEGFVISDVPGQMEKMAKVNVEKQ